MAINTPADIDPALMIELYLTDLQRESLPEEIFDRFSETIQPAGDNPVSIPEAVYLRLDAEATGARTAKIPLIKELSGNPNIGANSSPLGNEEDWIVKHFTARYTDISHATTNQKYGIKHIDRAPYQIQQYRNIGLGKFFKQYFGKMQRQTLTECMSENLKEDPHFLDDVWSPHWYVPNVVDARQPQFDMDNNNHTDNIVEALLLAGTGGYAAGTVVYFQRLEVWAREVAMIVPLENEEGQYYIVVIPTPTARWMKNPATGFGVLGDLYRAFDGYSERQKFLYPGSIGKIGNLVIYEDPRYPTLLPSGSGSFPGSCEESGCPGHRTMTVAYRGQGNADDGSSDPRDTSANSRMLGWLMGKGAILEWMPEGFHWEYEYEAYDKFYGTGVFCSVGMMMPIYNISNGITENVQQNSSICLPFARPPELV
jgi:hypothetical protein